MTTLTPTAAASRPGLLAPTERAARIAWKRRQVLTFLRDEVYTSRAVIECLLDVTATPAKDTLAGLAREGLILHAELMKDGRPVHLWGITPDGQAVIAAELDAAPSARHFRPSDVGLSTLNHSLAVQRARVVAERAGWTAWRNGASLGKLQPDEPRTDALAVSPDGQRWAVEVELTNKTARRYERVLFDRLRAIKTGHFDKVVWLSPDAGRCASLERLIKSIEEVNVEHAGRKQIVKIDPAVHHPRLAFVTLPNWPNF